MGEGSLCVTWSRERLKEFQRLYKGASVPLKQWQELLACKNRREAEPPWSKTALVAVDCRVFQDPGKKIKNHLGFHPTIMEGLMRQRAWIEQGSADVGDSRARQGYYLSFKEWLERFVCAPLKAVLQEGKHRTIEVLCYCRSGRHRSVAVSQLLAHAIPHGYEVRMEHYAKHAWQWQLGSCSHGDCQACFGEHAQRSRQEMAREIRAILLRSLFDKLPKSDDSFQ